MHRGTVFDVFFSTASVKKDTENCAPGKLFGPCYFVMTLKRYLKGFWKHFYEIYAKIWMNFSTAFPLKVG